MDRIIRIGVVCTLFGMCLLLVGASTGEAALRATLPGGAALEEGMVLSRHATITFLYPDDPGAQLAVYLDGAFYAALAGSKGSFVLPLDLVDAKSGEHRLRVEAYGAGGEAKEALEMKFQIQGEISRELMEQGVPLESRLPTGEPNVVEVAVVSKVVGPREGDYPPILKYLNGAVTARIVETLHQAAERGLPTLEREVQEGKVWTFLPAEDRYGMGSVPDKGRKAQFTVRPSGEALTGPEQAGLANLGILTLGLPNRRVQLGESWASAMGMVLDLTGMQGRIATGNHLLSGLDWLGEQECAVIDSKYSLDGPLTLVFGEQPFLLSRVTAEGTRRSYYDFKAGRFLMTRERVNCSIFLTEEEKERLEALLKPIEKAPKVATGLPSVVPTTGPPLGGPRGPGVGAAAGGGAPARPVSPMMRRGMMGGMMGGGMGMMGTGEMPEGMMGGMMGGGMGMPPSMMGQQPPVGAGAPAAAGPRTTPTAAQPAAPAQQLPQGEKPEEIVIALVQPAALVVNYDLDLLTVSK